MSRKQLIRRKTKQLTNKKRGYFGDILLRKNQTRTNKQLIQQLYI